MLQLYGKPIENPGTDEISQYGTNNRKFKGFSLTNIKRFIFFLSLFLFFVHSPQTCGIGCKPLTVKPICSSDFAPENSSFN